MVEYKVGTKTKATNNTLEIFIPKFHPVFKFGGVTITDYVCYKPDLVVLPELASTGYYIKDIYLYPEEVEKLNKKFRDEVLKFLYDNHKTEVLTTLPLFLNNGALVNASVLLRSNKILGVKKYLPNYGVFNEKRYFSSHDGKPYGVLNIKGFNIGVLICEDGWYFENWKEMINSEGKIDLIISLNASPYEYGKLENKIKMFIEYVKDVNVPLLYVNYSGTFDEVTFDGNSFFITEDGNVIENIKYLALYKNSIYRSKILNIQNSEYEKIVKNVDELIKDVKPNKPVMGYCYETYDTTNDDIIRSEYISKLNSYTINTKQTKYEQYARVIRNNIETYLMKTGFKDVIIGISGGIDSATVLYLIKDIPNINIHAYFLPIRPFTKDETYRAIEIIKKDSGVSIETVDLTEIFNNSKNLFNINEIIALANLQARLRANFLLTKANELNAILLTCSNKTELAYGYYTLGGDSEGGYAPLKDILKTEVFGLAEYLGVPRFIIKRKPTAELFVNDISDEEQLGATYETLDRHLIMLIKERRITSINKRILKYEFKRRQSPIGPKLSELSFNQDEWKFPI